MGALHFYNFNLNYFEKNLSVHLKINIPKTMQIQNIITLGLSVIKLAIPGPGQTPPIPQPIPNNAEPIINRLSISFAVGSEKLSA